MSVVLQIKSDNRALKALVDRLVKNGIPFIKVNALHASKTQKSRNITFENLHSMLCIRVRHCDRVLVHTMNHGCSMMAIEWEPHRLAYKAFRDKI